MAQNQQRAPQRTAQRTQTGQRTQAGKKRISKKKKRQQRNRMLVMALVFALCVTGVVYFLWPKGGNGGDTKQTPTGSATPKPGDPTPTGTAVSPGVIDPGGEDTIDWKTMPLTGLEFDEAMSSNSKYAELDGKFYDWVELLNSSSVAINLSEYWISDSKDNPQKYQLPNVTLGAGERYIIYCNGVGEGNQAPFKIKSSGEKIYLSNKDGFCDRIKIPGDLPADSSYGRKDGEWMYFDDPAPGRENGEGYAARTSVPEANYVTGVYNGPLMVTLFGEGTIYYTTDGSKPTTSSKVYVDGITVTGVTTIRAMAVKDGRESQEAAYTYVIDSTTHTLPILVVNGPYDTILGANGVVKKISDRNLEAQAMMTLIENGEEKFSIPCGITLHGNDSRNMAKQNFTVHFRSAYGASKLNYKLFDDIDLEVFNSILLKGGSERFNMEANVRYNHSVDFDMAYDNTLAGLSRVNTVGPGASAKLSYRLGQLSLSSNVRFTGRYSRGDSQRFQDINACDYQYGLTAQYTIPLLQVSMGTDITMFSRKGYNSSMMNTDDLICNAIISRSFMNEKLTLKLQAFDILHELSNKRYSVDAQGRTETLYNSIPNYVMLSASYRFSQTPKRA